MAEMFIVIAHKRTEIAVGGTWNYDIVKTLLHSGRSGANGL